jgi:Bardet-Biedl syndrome 2 protein
VELALATTNSTTLRAVLVFAEGVFDGESLIVHPLSSSPSGSGFGLEPNAALRVPIYPPRDTQIDLHIKAS